MTKAHTLCRRVRDQGHIVIERYLELGKFLLGQLGER